MNWDYLVAQRHEDGQKLPPRSAHRIRVNRPRPVASGSPSHIRLPPHIHTPRHEDSGTASKEVATSTWLERVSHARAPIEPWRRWRRRWISCSV